MSGRKELVGVRSRATTKAAGVGAGPLIALAAASSVRPAARAMLMKPDILLLDERESRLEDLFRSACAA